MIVRAIESPDSHTLILGGEVGIENLAELVR